MRPEDWTEESLLDHGLAVLRDLLGPEWEVTVQPPARETRSARHGFDAFVQVKGRGDSTFAELLVEARTRVSPRQVAEQLLPTWDLLQQVGHHRRLLVIAPWIAPRVQSLLRDDGIGYVDLTGNVYLRVSRPAIALYTQGASRSPWPSAPSSKATLVGPKAGRLVRLLVDVAPPYMAKDIAAATDLSLSYVSRLLDSLADQLLIRRKGRVVTDVDWAQLLRARAEHYTLLRHNSYVGMVAPNGTDAVLNILRSMPEQYRKQLAITGSYAARAVAPLATGGQLMLYHTAGAPRLRAEIGDDLGLLEADRGADVLLLRAHDRVVFERTADQGGVRRVALSQLVLDCLGGPGRLSSEGEAVLQYMQDNTHLWRLDRLAV